jgi:hypothetical protein
MIGFPERRLSAAVAGLIVALSLWVSCGGAPGDPDRESFVVAEKPPATCGPRGSRETIASGRWWREKIGDVVGPVINTHDTEFAPGCTDEAFDSLRLGASRDDVERQLGSPLRRWEGSISGCEYWSYSRRAIPGSNYLQRNVEFDSTGALVEKHRHFYAD